MIKLIKEYPPFKKDELITFGAVKDAELVSKGLAVWTKISSTHYNTK